jgi:hypothetical protein
MKFVDEDQSKDEFNADKEKREKRRKSEYAAKWQAKVKQRTGITRHNHKLIVKGIPIAGFLKSPEIIRERYCHKPFGRFYHFAVERFTLRTDDGRVMTCLRGKCADAHRGYSLSVTGFYSVKIEG